MLFLSFNTVSFHVVLVEEESVKLSTELVSIFLLGNLICIICILNENRKYERHTMRKDRQV